MLVESTIKNYNILNLYYALAANRAEHSGIDYSLKSLTYQARRRGGSRGSNEPPLQVNGGG